MIKYLEMHADNLQTYIVEVKFESNDDSEQLFNRCLKSCSESG